MIQTFILHAGGNL